MKIRNSIFWTLKTTATVALSLSQAHVSWALLKQSAPSSLRDSRSTIASPDRPTPGPALDWSKMASVNQITDSKIFDAFSSPGEGVIKTSGMKFIIDLRDREPAIYFMNGNYLAPNSPSYVKFHYYFAQRFLNVTADPESFNRMTYFTTDWKDRKFVAGTLQKYSIVSAGSQTKEFYGFQFYPQDSIAEEGVLAVAEILKKSVNIPSAQIQFVSYGVQQTVAKVLSQIKSLGFGATSVDEIYKSIPYIAMNKGEAWGYLRINPKSDSLTPKDIPVFDELPLDLTVVAGVITTVIQDSGSHVNLKSKQRGTPNMVLRDPRKLQDLISQFKDRPIHLTISSEGFKYESATDQEVEAHVRGKSNRPWFDFKVVPMDRLLSFDEMAQTRTATQVLPYSQVFGGKASKLGFLAHPDILGEGSAIHKRLGYRLTPLGFGIPTSFYFEFIEANPRLKEKINNLIETEMQLNGKKTLPPDQKVAAIAEIQKLFYSATVPSNLVKLLDSKIRELEQDFAKHYPKSTLKRMKFRSSSNAEDVEDFDGAGLHDSFSAKTKEGLGDPAETCRVIEDNGGVTTKQEMEPETALCALKGVYASLWNKRAVEERTYARINHKTAGMGIAVNPAYSLREKTEGIQEIANGVLITKILAGHLYGYQFSLNTADNLVTNPTPGTQSEVVLSTFLGDEKPEYTITQFAKTSAANPIRTESLVSRDTYNRIIELAKAVELGYCKANRSYYPNFCDYAPSDLKKPKSLDMEFKIFSNGEVIMKQVREFSGH